MRAREIHVAAEQLAGESLRWTSVKATRTAPAMSLDSGESDEGVTRSKKSLLRTSVEKERLWPRERLGRSCRAELGAIRSEMRARSRRPGFLCCQRSSTIEASVPALCTGVASAVRASRRCDCGSVPGPVTTFVCVERVGAPEPGAGGCPGENKWDETEAVVPEDNAAYDEEGEPEGEKPGGDARPVVGAHQSDAEDGRAGGREEQAWHEDAEEEDVERAVRRSSEGDGCELHAERDSEPSCQECVAEECDAPAPALDARPGPWPL